MSPKPVGVASYPRVSKDDGFQETDNKLVRLLESCEQWEGHELVAEYVDRESGIGKTIGYPKRLDACGVAFKSHFESIPDTDNELTAHGNQRRQGP